jgi:ABC-type lipoprotein export system ATPase subunit
MREDYIMLEQVTCRYGARDGANALAEFSLSVPQGQFLAVVGGAGAGKSALLRLVAGLMRPLTGRVVVGGMDLGAASEAALAGYRRRAVGVVAQRPVMLPGLTAAENVVLPLIAARGQRAQAEARGVAALEALGAQELAPARVETLSAGQIALVALARALVHEPELILADEPTAALDVRGAAAALERLRELHQQGCTVIVASHHGANMDGAERCLRLDRGTVVADDVLTA